MLHRFRGRKHHGRSCSDFGREALNRAKALAQELGVNDPRMHAIRDDLLGVFGVLVFTFGLLFMSYGQADPCRALAVERARRSAAGTAVEPWTRVQTSQMSTGACAGGLLDSWGERLTHYVR